jgi:hypothetical protein
MTDTTIFMCGMVVFATCLGATLALMLGPSINRSSRDDD